MTSPAKRVFLLLIALSVTVVAWAEPVRGAGPGLLEATKELFVNKKTDESAEWITEKTGQFLPLDLQFVDEAGKNIRLSDIIDRPTLFLPIYFYCPNICSKNLANLAVALGNLKAEPGRDYRVIALSFNESENFKDAAEAKKNYLKILPEDFPADEWRFLTGDLDAIKAVTDAVGFRFQKVDDETFIHPAALMAIGADGKIIRYIYGSFLAGDIDLAVASAASGTPAMSVRRLLAFCFNYDPHGKTSLFTTVKIIVLLVFGLAAIAFFLYFRRTSDKGAKAPLRQDTTTP